MHWSRMLAMSLGIMVFAIYPSTVAKYQAPYTEIPTVTDPVPTANYDPDDFVTVLPCGEEALEEKAVKLVVSLIQLENFVEAQQEFWSLTDPLKEVSKIVSQVYKNNNSESEGAKQLLIAKFVREANAHGTGNKCGLLSTALNALGSEFESASSSESSDPSDDYHFEESPEIDPLVLILHYDYISSCVKNGNSSGDASPISSQPMIDKLLQNWVKDIKRWSFHEILNLERKSENEILTKVLPELIRRTYASNLTNFDRVANLNSRFKSMSLRSLGWLTILQELKMTSGGTSSREMMKLAYWVRNDMEKIGEQKQEIVEETVKMFKSVKLGIPEERAKLVWGNRCTILNLATGESLFAPEHNETLVVAAENNEKLQVYTENRDWWRLEPFLKHYSERSNDVVYFPIRSLDWRRSMPYLCVEDSKSGKELLAGKVQTCYKTDLESRMMTSWILDPVTTRDGVEAFQMFTWNKEWQRFDLYVGGKERDTSFAGQIKDVLAKEEAYKLDESYWLINCE